MVFKHIGEIKKGVEEPKDWKDATESYFLSEDGDQTVLKTELHFDNSPQFEEYFSKTFPEALKNVKQLSEA